MSIERGDTVMTVSGRLCYVRSFFDGGMERKAILQPLQPEFKDRRTNTTVSSLALVRSRELSLAFHYAAEGDRVNAETWLSRAEERNDDMRAALCLGSDRILDLETVT